MSWNFGDILDGLGGVLPADAPALAHGDDRVSWGELTARSNRLARALLERGAQPGDKVAFYMRNRCEYLVALAACFKARLVHVNVNYRYLDDELYYILENADAKFVLFGDEFAERAAGLRARLPGVAAWLQIDGDPPDFAESFAKLCEQGDDGALELERCEDDLLFLYTGGTTGMPKGVMWRAADLWGALGGGGMISANGGTPPASVAHHVKNVGAFGPGPVQLPACPLMHGTGLFTTILNMMGGGCCVTLTGAGFDAEELFDVVERHRVESVVIVGDAFGKPMLNALDAHPGRWDLSALRVIMSSGVMWSREVKDGLLKHHGGMLCADLFGSSEAMGFGSSVTSAAAGTKTAKFTIGDGCKVFTEEFREVTPGSGERGFIARSGPIPLGYYKDPEKTAKTFPTIDGVRYSVPGDWCTVEADGTLNLLGRGSVCINTAGEKVYPEEVEESLKTHPEVEDALVVGLPDEKWGNAVTALVELRPDAACSEDALRQHVRGQLAGYKTPKRVFVVERMFRAPNGKADYKAAAEHARKQLG
jgi:fatty-acyl-CoA synthase